MAVSQDSSSELRAIFDELNHQHFDGLLDPIPLHWNNRLRSCAGRFFPGVRKRIWGDALPAKIEVASYLLKEPNALELIRDTLGHEMIHYWLWMRRKPFGHTEEFYAKMNAMGVSRYNPVPRTRPYKWTYRCGHCDYEFPARRRLARNFACAKCCNQYAGGKFDVRFKLTLAGPYREPVIP